MLEVGAWSIDVQRTESGPHLLARCGLCMTFNLSQDVGVLQAEVPGKLGRFELESTAIRLVQNLYNIATTSVIRCRVTFCMTRLHWLAIWGDRFYCVFISWEVALTIICTDKGRHTRVRCIHMDVHLGHLVHKLPCCTASSRVPNLLLQSKSSRTCLPGVFLPVRLFTLSKFGHLCTQETTASRRMKDERLRCADLARPMGCAP